MNVNTLEAYYRGKGQSFPKKRMLVYKSIRAICMARHFSPHAKEISKDTTLPLESVTGRISELKKQCLIEHYKDIIINGRKNACYRPTNIEKPLSLKPVHNYKKTAEMLYNETVELVREVQKLKKKNKELEDFLSMYKNGVNFLKKYRS